MQATKPVTALKIELSAKALTVVLAARRHIRIPWEKCSKRLAAAKTEERLRADLSPGGYGIYWPLLDEDLSIDGLLRDFGRE